MHLIRTPSLNAGNSYSPRVLSRQAHAEPPGAGFHAPSYHKPVAGLKDVQGAGDGGEGHGTHEDGDVSGQTAGEEKCELGSCQHRRAC